MKSDKEPGTVWLVNQFAPPDRAPTAKLLGDLAVGLEARGWKVRFIACTAGYRAASVAGWRRWWRDLKAHARLFGKTLTGLGPDIIICLSDPPALVVTMACSARLRGARLVYWPMDVYPEIAAELGALSRTSLIYRSIKRAVDWAVRRCASVVCLDEDMREKFRLTAGALGPVIAPWPLPESAIPDASPEPASDLVRWTYSGNLGRAHEYETLLRAQRLLEDEARPFELVFQGGGALRIGAEQLAAELGLQHCRWLGYVGDDELVTSLLQSHLCIATERPEMLGLLWPSKLALLDLLPRPIVWVGPRDGAIAAHLREKSGMNAVFGPGDHRELAEWLAQKEGEIRGAARSGFSPELIRSQIRGALDGAVSAWHSLLTSLLI